MKNISLKLGLAIVALMLLGVVYGFAETYFTEVTRVDIVDSRIPAEFDGKTIVLISDIHYGPSFSAERVGSIAAMVNALHPDYIVLTGDFVDKFGRRDFDAIKPCFEELKVMNSSVPKYAVLGNHDHWMNARAVLKGLEYAGIMDVENVCTNLSSGDSGIRFCGVGDLWEDEQIVDSGNSNYTILLSHNPDYAEQLEGKDVNLVLSGHTHGGQATFFGLWAPYIPSEYGQKYRMGLVDNGYNKVYVTRGVGQSYPFRFFARPEIIVLTLRSSR